MSAEAKTQTAVDSETGISFKYSTDYSITDYDLWLIPTEGIADSYKHIYWHVFNTSYVEGTLKERCMQFGDGLASADGMYGGTHAQSTFLTSMLTASKDEALIFQLNIKAEGDGKKWDGKLAGYLLGVDLKPSGEKPYRHLFIYSPSKDELLKIAASIDVPRAYSIHDPTPAPPLKPPPPPYTSDKLTVTRAEYYADKGKNGEVVVEGRYDGMPLKKNQLKNFIVSIGNYRLHLKANEIEKAISYDGYNYEYRHLLDLGAYFSIKSQFGEYSIIIQNPTPLNRSTFMRPVSVKVQVDNAPATAEVLFKMIGHEWRNGHFTVKPSQAALKTMHPAKIFYEFSKAIDHSVSSDVETQIFALNPVAGTSQLVFSDFETSMTIGYPCGSGGSRGGLIVAANGRIFAAGTERNLTNISNQDCPRHQEVYELYLDGSNRFRKIAEVSVGDYTLTDLFVSPTGDRFGYLGAENNKRGDMIMIHDATSGKIVNKIALKPLEHEGSEIWSRGWRKDGRLGLDLAPAAEEDDHPWDGYYTLDLRTGKFEKSKAEAYTYVDDCIRVLPIEDRMTTCSGGQIRLEGGAGKTVEISITTPASMPSQSSFKVIGWKD